MNWEEEYEERYELGEYLKQDIKSFIKETLAAQKQELKRTIEGMKIKPANLCEQETNAILDVLLVKLDL